MQRNDKYAHAKLKVSHHYRQQHVKRKHADREYAEEREPGVKPLKVAVEERSQGKPTKR